MIPVLFENDDILAVNKPEGLASIPEGAKGRDCLLSLLVLAFPEKLHVVHRLDKEVSSLGDAIRFACISTASGIQLLAT